MIASHSHSVLAVACLGLGFIVNPCAAAPGSQPSTPQRGTDRPTQAQDRPAEGTPALFMVFAPDQQPDSLAALAQTLSPGEPQRVRLAKTAREALDWRSDVLVLFLDRTATGHFGSPESLAELKKKKVIGIGYGAAELLGTLGLEISGGNCAHGGIEPPPQIRIQRTALLPQWSVDTITAFRIDAGAKPMDWEKDYNVMMYLPSKDERARFVEAIARDSRDGAYAPIVKQNNYILVGLAAPATTWTGEYRSFFRALANGLAKAPQVPFSTATWEATRPGQYEFDLARGRSTEESPAKEFYFRFPSAAKFTAVLEHTGSRAVMMIFRGDRGSRSVRKDARNGETLRIEVNVTEEDMKRAGTILWTLRVSNFDPTSPAHCKLRIEQSLPSGPVR
jgi:hypothetical protein